MRGTSITKPIPIQPYSYKEWSSTDSSYLEQSEFLDAKSILSVLLDMFDQDSDQNSDLDQLPDLQPVSDTDSDLESQATLEGGSYSIFAPLIANLEPNSTDLDTKSNSGSSLGDLTGYELRKVGDILAWKVQKVLTHCQPFPDDETKALPSEFFEGKL